MNKQVTKTLASLTLFVMLEVPVLYGQSGMLVANIPFDFNVGKASLPSGEYNVKSMTQGSVVIRSKDGRQLLIDPLSGASVHGRHVGFGQRPMFGMRRFKLGVISYVRDKSRGLGRWCV